MSLFSSRESRAVHPHIRGAYRALGGATTPTRGSSPHTWGIHWLPANHANPRRFIPTYVGHTRPVVAGSRPRRFIPTYVGHTDLKRWFHGLSAVHPHIRGAYGGARLDAAGVYGFIPTYVGHTCRMQRSQRQASVHPHIRGAYASSSAWLHSAIGSSPHTWGIPFRYRKYGPVSRFIPTYVGHTPGVGDEPRTLRFIPTYVGHTACRGSARSARGGSSPHTWGIHWTTVRKMAGFSHFSYDFTRKSYFVQGLVFFGVIGAEAFPTHRRGRSQCLPGAHGGSVRNL